MLQFDTYEAAKYHDIPAKELREKLKEAKLSPKGNVQDSRKRCKKAKPPIETKKKFQKLIKGYVGSQIGLMEVLWRRGYIDPAAKTLPTESEARAIAKEIPAFKNELSEIEIHMNSIGVEVVFTPKGYCEIASRGIEYA